MNIIFRFVFILSFFSSLQALSAEITPQQIAQFKKLPPEQQKALAQSMGVDLSNINLNGLSGSRAAETPSAPTLDELVKPRIETKDDVPVEIVATEQANSSDTLQFSQKLEKVTLKTFGYDLFAGEPSTFAPVTDVAVPADYVLAPGDNLSINLYGKETELLYVNIDRQGNIFFPQIGPINLSGQTFAEAKALLLKLIQERKIGVQASISMGELRTIRIFVLGEAHKPASYTLSSLATVTQALYAAGGVNNIGSLRNIQIKRRGKVVATFDLYDLLLKGDTSNDVNLLAGDVVFIPTIGKTVGVTGEVIRPAIYELKNEKSIAELLHLAGGLSSTAFEQIIKIQRINDNGLRSVVSVDLANINQQVVNNGDVLEVASVLDTLSQSVTLQGHIARPGVYGWHNGLTLGQLLPDINQFKEQADLSYILIMRKNLITGKLNALDVDFSSFIENNNQQADLALLPQDSVYIFNKDNNRSESLYQVLAQLEKQTQLNDFADIVEINGAVRNPGRYPLTKDANVVSLLRAAMGYKTTSETTFSILARKDKNNNVMVFYLDLTKDSEKALPLSPMDRLFVFDQTEKREQLLAELNQELIEQADKNQTQNIVNITGDVQFPGQYPYVVNMTPKQLINIAGGYKESSYLLDAELTHFIHDGAGKATIKHQVISLTDDSLQLKPLDTLRIKRIPEWQEQRTVKISGEVVFPGVYVLQKGETLKEVIKRAGGLTSEADAKGAVFTREALRAKEQEQITRLAKEIKGQAALLAVNDGPNKKSVDAEEAEQLVSRLEEIKAVGRLVINLPEIINRNLVNDVRLDNGDALYIPKVQQSISVMGEVQYAASHLYSEFYDVDDYINRSGGMKARADANRVYIIKADGSVMLLNQSGWFDSSEDMLSAGDTIVVPLDLEYRDSLGLWSIATQIMYNTAVSIAAIGSI